MGSHAGPGPESLSGILDLTRLFEEQRPRLLAMLRARIDPALERRVGVEAILQETFLTARRRWHERPAPEKMAPYAWLVWLARQCLVDAWRREHSEAEMPWPEHSSNQLGMRLVGTNTSPSVALVRQEVQALVRQALDALEPIDREIIWLIDFDQLAYRDAAQILNIRENAAHVRHYRALKRFKELIPDSLRPEPA